MTSQICSWFRLPIKRKTIDNQTIHQTKKRRTAIQDSTHNTREAESGWFTALPIELLHMLFQYLDKESIITFSSLSKDLNSDVLQYFLSTPGFTHLLVMNNVNVHVHVPKSQLLIMNSRSLKHAGIEVH